MGYVKRPPVNASVDEIVAADAHLEQKRWLKHADLSDTERYYFNQELDAFAKKGNYPQLIEFYQPLVRYHKDNPIKTEQSTGDSALTYTTHWFNRPEIHKYVDVLLANDQHRGGFFELSPANLKDLMTFVHKQSPLDPNLAELEQLLNLDFSQYLVFYHTY